MEHASDRKVVDHALIEGESLVILGELMKQAPEKLTANEVFILGIHATTLSALRALIAPEEKT